MSSVRGRYAALRCSCAIFFLLFGVLLLHGASRRMAPRITAVTCMFGDAALAEHCKIPLRVLATAPSLRVQFTMDLPERSARRFHVGFGGCLQSMHVNGTDALRNGPPRCDDGLGYVLDLSDVLHAGKNDVSLVLEQESTDIIIHRLSLRPSRWDASIFPIVLLGLLLLLVCGALIIISLFPPRDERRMLAWVFLFGIVLRAAYVAATPYAVRAYDWAGHADYIRYVAEHLRIPPAELGWETYQPPLYYFLAAPWIRFGLRMGSTPHDLLTDLQWGSWFLSSLTLFLGLWIGAILFPGKHRRWEMLLFALALAVFPSLVFSASRLSNDTLSYVLAFAFIGFLVRFFREERKRDWDRASVLAACGILTKSTALFLPVIALLTLIMKKGMAMTEKSKLLVRLLFVVALLAGWFFVLRFGIEGETSIVGNARVLHPISAIERSLTHFLFFNPLRVLQCPFPADTGHLAPVCGREFFFEYLFRTAFLGNCHCGTLAPLARGMLLVAMLLLPVLFFGWWRSRHAFGALPLTAVALVLLGIHIAYRFTYSYSITQDFRYSLPLTIPLTFFLVRGITALSPGMRDIALGVFFSVLVLSTAFIAALILAS